MQQPVYAKSGLTQARLAIIRSEINTNLANYNASQQELVNASQQVSFKQLYESVSKLQANSPDKCPACKTPLTQTALNPYAHADEELQSYSILQFYKLNPKNTIRALISHWRNYHKSLMFPVIV